MCVKATPIYTKSDGMIERLQQAMFVKDLKDDWDQHLPLLTIAFNSSLQESTKCTPNILMLRMKTSFPIELSQGSSYRFPCKLCQTYVERLKEAMQKAFDFPHETFAEKFPEPKISLLVDIKCFKYTVFILILTSHFLKLNLLFKYNTFPTIPVA